MPKDPFTLPKGEYNGRIIEVDGGDVGEVYVELVGTSGESIETTLPDFLFREIGGYYDDFPFHYKLSAETGKFELTISMLDLPTVDISEEEKELFEKFDQENSS